MKALKHIKAILLLPFTVTIVIPGIILYLTCSINIGLGLPAPFNLVTSFLGILLICMGVTLMFKTISLFARIGKGTLAPWDPTQKLVVHGIYRHVRNPMMTGVFCILMGEVIFMGSMPLFAWFTVFLILNLIFIPLFEEPNLEKRFGEEYKLYKENVPRLVPRLSPWENEDTSRRS